MRKLACILSVTILLASCGGSSVPSKTANSAAKAGSPAERISNAGFGQAVLIDGGAGPSYREDLFLVSPAYSSRNTMLQYFVYHANASAGVALGYITVPIAMNPNFTSGGYLCTGGNLNDWLYAAGVALLDSSDLSVPYPNWPEMRYLNLSQQSTRNKILSLLGKMLVDVPSVDGFFIDMIDASAPVPFAYPDTFLSVLREFKATKRTTSGYTPMIFGNFYSLAQHRANNYQAFDHDVFEGVIVEEYKKGTAYTDNTPSDVIDFHKKYPHTCIIVNTGLSNLSHPTDNDNAKAREAVTLAALVGGLHAVDNGSYNHGLNTYATQYLNFPNLRPGKPINDLIDNAQYYRRDYNGMVAIYAKTDCRITLPDGYWKEFWTGNQWGTGSISITAGNSYMFFKI